MIKRTKLICLLILISCTGVAHASAPIVESPATTTDRNIQKNDSSSQTDKEKEIIQTKSKSVWHPNLINGFYPIWENTGLTLDAQQIYIGTSNFQYGVTDWLHLGIQPMNYIHRAPNLHFEFSAYDKARIKITGKINGLLILKNADDFFFSHYYSSHLFNPYNNIWIFPLSTALTWSPFSWFRLHNNATALLLFAGGDINNEVTFGDSLMAEFIAYSGHSLILHVAEIGFWHHEFFLMGASYRLNYKRFDMHIGYFYRLREEGNQNLPMISLGLWF